MSSRYINFQLRGPGDASVQVRGRIPSSIQLPSLSEPWQKGAVGFFSALAAAGFDLVNPDEQTAEAAQKELTELMSDISEARWCAGWLVNLEHILWDEITESGGSDEADELHALSQAAGGWIRWRRPDDLRGIDLKRFKGDTIREGAGAVFVPLDEWEKLHAEWKAKQP